MKEELLALLATHAAAGTPCVLATVVRTESPTSAQAHPGDAAVVTADGTLHGWVGGSCAEPLVRREALRAIADGQPRLVRVVPSEDAAAHPSGGAFEVFVDPQLPRPMLLVVGNTPAARTLLQLAGPSGFRTAAVHPGATTTDFPGAGLVLSSLEDLASLTGALDVWPVVATMGHYDDTALEAVLHHLPGTEVALVAGESRAAAVFDGLLARGVADAEVGRVRTPAGEHHGGSQEEIALHALDDVVVRRRERQAARRRDADAVALSAEESVPAVAVVAKLSALPDPPEAPEARSVRPPAAATIELFAVDAVCGMTVDVATSMHRFLFGGTTFHFCSSMCAMEFQSDPARFVSAATA